MKTSDVRRRAILSAAGRCGLMNRSEISHETGIPKSTLYKRMSNPGDLTVTQLCLIDRKLHLTDEELIQVVRGKI